LPKTQGFLGRRKDGAGPLPRAVSQPKRLGLSSSQLVSITWKKHGHHRREHQFPGHHQGFHGDSDQDISATYRDSATLHRMHFFGARFAPAVCQGTHLGQIGPTIRVMGWYGCGPV